MILLRNSAASPFKARLYGLPILCGKTTEVSTTDWCSSLSAFRSLSRLWPIRIVRLLNMDRSTA